LIEQPVPPIEQPEVEGVVSRSAPATPGLLALRDEAAMPTVSTGSAKPTVPLLFALLVIAAMPALAATLLRRLGR
jgi:hypothetical protein